MPNLAALQFASMSWKRKALLPFRKGKCSPVCPSPRLPLLRSTQTLSLMKVIILELLCRSNNLSRKSFKEIDQSHQAKAKSEMIL